MNKVIRARVLWQLIGVASLNNNWVGILLQQYSKRFEFERFALISDFSYQIHINKRSFLSLFTKNGLKKALCTYILKWVTIYSWIKSSSHYALWEQSI